MNTEAKVWVVYDRHTGQIVSKPMSFKSAIRSVDKRDNAYGGYRFGRKMVEEATA